MKRCWNCQELDTMAIVKDQFKRDFLKCTKCGATANIGDPDWMPRKSDIGPRKKVVLKESKKK